jgi:hypothetical protein
MRTTGAAQDDLKILLAKNFIRQLNDDLVVFVTDPGTSTILYDQIGR